MRLEKTILEAIIEAAQQAINTPDVIGDSDLTITNIHCQPHIDPKSVYYDLAICQSTYNEAVKVKETRMCDIQEAVSMTLKCLSKTVAKKVSANISG